MDEARYYEILRRLGMTRDSGEENPSMLSPEQLTRRVTAFHQQVHEWVRSGRVGVPLLVLPDASIPQLGHCVSCGEAVSEGDWRCVLCLRAVEIVLDLPPSEAAP